MVTATAMVSGIARRAKMIVAAGFLALALVAGAGIGTTPVSAERVGPGMAGIAPECRGLQDRERKLVDELGTNPSSSRREDILTELRDIGTTWVQIGCRNTYGDIGKDLATLPPTLVRGGVVAIPVGGTTARTNG